MNIDFSHQWFTSFGDARLKQPLRRMRKQARQFGFLDSHTFVIDESGLDPDFRQKMCHRLIPGSRGFGYWCWKPQVILQTLKKMDEGDILLYSDVGCHLNVKGMAKFNSFVEHVQSTGILAFELGGKSAQWTKGDLLDYFQVRNMKSVVDAPQIMAGVILFRKSQQAIDFVCKWLKIMTENFALIDDSASHSPNLPEFIEHRHDQSAFSILCRIHGVSTLPARDELGLNPEVSPVQIRGDKSFGWRRYVPKFLKDFLLKCQWLADLNNALAWRVRA